MRATVLVLVLALGGCPRGGSGGGTQVTPTLPGDDPKLLGENEKPKEKEEPPKKAERDPWLGRTDLIPPPTPLPPAQLKLPAVERFTLKNGLPVRVLVRRDVPAVSMQLAIGVGLLDEPRDRRGLAAVAAMVLTRETANLYEGATRPDIYNQPLVASSDLENTHITCSEVGAGGAKCAASLAKMMIESTYPEAQLATVRDFVLEQLGKARQSPETLGEVHLQNLLWGDDNIRGTAITAETVKPITRKELQYWHKTWYVPGNAMLVVVGDVDPKTLKPQLEKAFAKWKKKKVPKRTPSKAPAVSGLTVRLVDAPGIEQSRVVVGGLGIAHGDKDYIATIVMNEALGGGTASSRLAKATRGRGRALSGYERWRRTGSFQMELTTTRAATLEALQKMLEALGEMRDTGPTADELAEAQAQMAGGHSLRFESNADVAAAVTSAELHGLGADYLQEFPARVMAVTVEEARAAAKKHLDPANLAVVIVGDGATLGKELAKLGVSVDEVGWDEPVSRRERVAVATKKTAPPDAKKTAQGKKLLAAALAAKGGEKKLKAISDIYFSGKIAVRGGTQTLEGDMQRWLKLPARLRLELKVFDQTLTTVLTEKGAFQTNGEQVQDFPEEFVTALRDGFYRDRDFILLRHLEKDTVVQALPSEKVGKVSYDAVLIRRSDGTSETKLLLDPKTHLVHRLVYEEGGAAAYEEFSDYREVDGLQLAFKQHAESPQQTFDVTIETIKINTGVSDELFARPKKTK